MLESLMVTCGKDAVLRVSIPTLLTKMVVSSALRLVKSAGITSKINIVVVLISTHIYKDKYGSMLVQISTCLHVFLMTL